MTTFFLMDALPEAAMTYFYGHLFAAEPEIRAMFPAAMGIQRRRFYQALQSRDEGYLETLGRAHRKFGVTEEHFPALRAALLATCRQLNLATADEDTVLAAFDRVAQIMLAAARDAAPQGPAWWAAEVTSHVMAAPGIAILTLRPEEPLPYLPGQHIPVQTPRWPRLWRPYSVACAPRARDSDAAGELTLHVRAVPGGLVSTALARHTRPGDILLLGAAEGAMTADLTSTRDVLCLAGGTGLAPLLAITEALAARAGQATGAEGRREIVVYHGARTMHGLYGLPMLRTLAAQYPFVKAVPATSVDRVPDAAHGTIPELAVRAWWRDRDIYISGPDAMITATVRALLDAGAPPDLLHYDQPAALLSPAHRPLLHPLAAGDGRPSCPAGQAGSRRKRNGYGSPWP
jgi:ferredoxin-NADP reductase/hemoglobin-like flavoprotein